MQGDGRRCARGGQRGGQVSARAPAARIREAVERHARVTFSRPGGPGGQNVNAVSTRVEVRMPIGRIPVGSRGRDLMRSRLANRVTSADELRVSARRERHQARNRALAVDRMVDLIVEATAEDARRVPTRPGAGARARQRRERERLAGKKKARRRPSEED
ncbi:MAG: aminoacyl-tRNA hydrolase [Actinobacteria bacterium]|nr:aminoacyl-tRNA hydrolase [Actinomycetota bacterium]